ncbi:MAG: hypothetical protein ACRC5H_05850, partial [Treponemataceae bacterium]
IFAGMYPPYQTLNLDYDITFPLGASLQYDYFSQERSITGFSAELGAAANLFYFRGNQKAQYQESIIRNQIQKYPHFSIHTSLGTSLRAFFKNNKSMIVRLGAQYTFSYLNAVVIPVSLDLQKQYDAERRKTIKHMFGFDANFFFNLTSTIKSGPFFGVTFNFATRHYGDTNSWIFSNAFKPYIGYRIGGTVYPKKTQTPLLEEDPITQEEEIVLEKFEVIKNSLDIVSIAQITEISMTEELSTEELLSIDENNALLAALVREYDQNLAATIKKAERKKSPIIISKFDLQGPDEEGFVSFLTEVKNISKKNIASIQFTLTPINEKGEIVFSSVGRSNVLVHTPDTLMANSTSGWTWLKLWQNKSIASIKMRDAHILFDDDSSIFIDNVANIILDEKIYHKNKEVEQKIKRLTTEAQ